MRAGTWSGPGRPGWPRSWLRVWITALVLLEGLTLAPIAADPLASPGFYRYPSPAAIASARNGQVFAAEPMTVTEPLQRASSRALRIMYRSQGAGGRPVAVTGYLLIPRGHPPRGGWPLIAWAHGTAGVGPDCAPSRSPNLYLPGSYHYEALITRMLSDGFAVVGTDYPGLGFPGQLHPYLQQGPEGRAVADSVMAARHLAPALGRRWFAVGHSQGGQAALATGERALRAPGLQFLGTVSFAPASHLALVVDAFSQLRPSSGIIFYIAAAYMSFIAVSARLFAPSMHYTDLLSRRLATEIPAAKRLCLIGLALYLQDLHPPLESILNPDWARNRQLRQFFGSAEPGKRRSAGPILLLQGGRDAAIPAHVTGLLFGRLCRLGNVVQYRVYARADHDTLLTQAYPAMARWLADRLAGRPARHARGGASCAPSAVAVTG
jgi:alpha-beta hydrolase superfamily lysophospholipase